MSEKKTEIQLNSESLPTPWFVDDMGGIDSTYVFSGDPNDFSKWRVVAQCFTDKEDGVSLQTVLANAELIKNSANWHQKLIECFKLFWDEYADEGNFEGRGFTAEEREFMRNVYTELGGSKLWQQTSDD